MHLAAKISPVREAERRGLELRATLRETPETPHDIDIIDMSETGFLGIMPAAVAIEPGTAVRIAALPIGSHVAIATRRDGRRHGFAFVNRISKDLLARAGDGDATSVVAFGLAGDAKSASPAAGLAVERMSARRSLATISVVALTLWVLLAMLLIVTARFV